MKTWLASAALALPVLLALRLEIFDIQMARSIARPLPIAPSLASRPATSVRAQEPPQESTNCLAHFDALERSSHAALDALPAETACLNADAVPAGPCRDFMRAAREAAYRATALDETGVPWTETNYAAALGGADRARSKCRDQVVRSRSLK